MATPKTTTKKTTTKAKSTTASKASTAKSTSVAAAAKPTPPTVVEAPTPVVLGPMMRKPELVNAVVSKTGMKKKDVKPIVEATLAVLGAALQDTRELNLEPLGKVKVTREKKRTTGKLLVARIRQNQDLPVEPVNADPKDIDEDVATPTAAE